MIEHPNTTQIAKQKLVEKKVFSLLGATRALPTSGDSFGLLLQTVLDMRQIAS